MKLLAGHINVLAWVIFGLSVASAQPDLTFEHVGGSDNGQTFRIYAMLPDGSIELSAVFGDAVHPLTISSDSGFYNDFSGVDFADEGSGTELADDSWFTLGAEPGAFQGEIQTVGLASSLTDWFGGGPFKVDSPAGGMWFCYPGSTSSNEPDENGRVLIAQLTSASPINVTFNFQYLDATGAPAQIIQASMAIHDVGCMDSAACNYDEGAFFEGPCEYAIEGYACDGSCLNDSDGDGVCDPFEVSGCTDNNACNFNYSATNDDGSCEYPIEGFECGDQVGFAYEMTGMGAGGPVYRIFAILPESTHLLSAVYGSAEMPLMIASTEPIYQMVGGLDFADEEASGDAEYSDVASDDSWLALGVEPLVAGAVDILSVGIDTGSPFFESGGDLVIDTPEGGMWFYLPQNTGAGAPDTEGKVLIAQIASQGDLSIQGNYQFINQNSESTQVVGATLTIESSYFPIGPGCMDSSACNFNHFADEDDGSCDYAETYYDCEGNCDNDTDLDGVCDELEVAGCTDVDGCNYNPDATDDDGSCSYALLGYDCDGNCLLDSDSDGVCDLFEVDGCTDDTACNFTTLATDDDGSCVYPSDECDDGDETSYADSLSTDCVCEGIPMILGCTDDGACNFNELANTDDGSCSVIDECGICGGPGAVLDCGCEPIPEGDCDCFGNVLENGGCGLGCTYPFAENYDPEATTNDFTCEYDLVELIESGYCLSSLIEEGIEIEDLLDLEVFAPSGGAGVRLSVIDTVAQSIYYTASFIGQTSWASDEDCIPLEIGTSTDYGSGQENTALIVSSGCAVNSVGIDAAAMLCYVYDGFGQEDWFLPSLDEAVMISENIYDFRSWTSSEYDGLKAYLVSSNFPPLAEYKSHGEYVRPVRTQSISESWYGESCLTEITYGCTDNNACNFSALALINNQTCIYPADGFDCSGACLNDADNDGVCDEDEVVGCTDESACNYSSLATDDDGTCLFLDACGICGGDGTTCEAECSNQEDEVAALGGCANAVLLLGCETLWNGTPLNEICPETCQNCPCESDFNENGVCDEDEVLGCTYIVACNFNQSAGFDDGSCVFAVPGYDCEGEQLEECGGGSDCVADLNNDGVIGSSDLLLLLADFGGSCPLE